MRRILPWIYALIFLIIAPILIFYTSGYRYNAKKGTIERNGTLIVDSQPGSALVTIDGQSTNQKTPITFQQLAPGWHHVLVTRSGYKDWRQDVLVRAERVTFLDTIKLWKQGDPTLISAGPYLRLENDPTRTRLLAFQSQGTSTQVGWWSPTNVPDWRTPTRIPSPDTIPVRWRSDGEAALLGGTDSETSSWLVQTANNQQRLDVLPDGHYHWSGNELIGSDGRDKVTINTNQGRIERAILPTSVIEQSGSIELRSTTSSSDQQLLADSSFLGQLFGLPRGKWSISQWQRPLLFLVNGNSWLGIRLRVGTPPDAMSVTGDYPRLSPDTKHLRAIFLNRYEISLWTPDQPSLVIWRQSTPIKQVIWNEDGRILYVADQNKVFALSIDLTGEVHAFDLATFDEVSSIAIQDTKVYVVGKRNNEQGIFQLPN